MRSQDDIFRKVTGVSLSPCSMHFPQDCMPNAAVMNTDAQSFVVCHVFLEPGAKLTLSAYDFRTDPRQRKHMLRAEKGIACR